MMNISKLTILLAHVLFSAKILLMTKQCLIRADTSHICGFRVTVITLFIWTAPDNILSENDSAEKEKEIKRLQKEVIGLKTFMDAFKKAMRNEVQKLKQRHEDEKDELKKKLHAEKFLRLIDAARKLKDIDSSPNPLALCYY